MNNSETLMTLIVGGRIVKQFSQRELARRIGISNSSLNDIENGRVAKPDSDILKRIAEELDLSLEQLLKLSGYSDVIDCCSNAEYKNKSTKSLKNMLETCRIFKYDILDFDDKKSRQATKIGKEIFDIKNKVKRKKEGIGNYSWDELINDINKIDRELNMIIKKYDCSKLPKDI